MAKYYRCRKCDLTFCEDEITSMDDNENDLCPACGCTEKHFEDVSNEFGEEE